MFSELFNRHGHAFYNYFSSLFSYRYNLECLADRTIFKSRLLVCPIGGALNMKVSARSKHALHFANLIQSVSALNTQLNSRFAKSNRGTTWNPRVSCPTGYLANA